MASSQIVPGVWSENHRVRSLTKPDLTPGKSNWKSSCTVLSMLSGLDTVRLKWSTFILSTVSIEVNVLYVSTLYPV